MRSVYIFLLSFCIFCSSALYAQVTGSFLVGGDRDKYYPVTFGDGGWGNNVATELQLGRSAIHENASWRGAFIAKFSFHTTDWGNGASFIDAAIAPGADFSNSITSFIGGWRDVTSGNNDFKIIIWLRGGSSTYHYQSNYAVDPVVYDGVQNASSYQETNGSLLSFKTAVDGIDLGDNQALLLKKIEELTLYIIDLKKEINDLKSKVNIIK